MFRPALFVYLLIYSQPLLAEVILVVQSYHKEYEWVQSHKRGLEETLSQHKLVYFEMDTKRIPTTQFESKAEEAWLIYQNIQPDLVMLADDNALEFLAPKLLTTNTPVVYLGINANPRKYNVVGAPNFHGVLERLLIKRSILLMNQFMPLDRVLILFDQSATSKAIFNRTFSQRHSLKVAGVDMDIKMVATYEHWKSAVKQAPSDRYDAILVGLYHNLVDKNGTHIPANDVIRWTSANTQLPPFALWDFSIGADKALGGYAISGYYQGKMAAQLAEQVIKGNSSSTMPLSVDGSQLIFSQTQLIRWNITIPSNIDHSIEMRR